MTSEKDKFSSKVFHDEAGYGSISSTLADAKNMMLNAGRQKMQKGKQI